MSDLWPTEGLQEGDKVLSEDEPGGRFTIIAIHEEKAWIQDNVRGQDLIVPLSACTRLLTVH
jgi:hypothetical protein